MPSIWTIPEDPNDIPGSQSISQASLIIEETESFNYNKWLIPLLLVLVVILALALLISVLSQSLGGNRATNYHWDMQQFDVQHRDFEQG